MASNESFQTRSRDTNPDPGVPGRATREQASLNDVRASSASSMLPIVAVMIAACFGAGAWFYYQNDAADKVGATATSAPASGNPAGGTAIPTIAEDRQPATATTFEQSSSFGKPDILVTVHPDPAQMRGPAARATAPRPILAKAKANRPANPGLLVPAPISREVALTERPRAVYPAQALRTREQGTVLVLAQVDVSGQVSDARVVRRSGSATLDRAAPNEVRRWKFAPALRDGQPIMASVEIPVSYRLDP